VAAVTALGAFLTGPSKPATTTRTACRRIIASLREALYSLGMRLGPVGPFVHRYKTWIGALILAVAALILATWSYPTWAVVLWITFFVALALALRELLDTGPDGDTAIPTHPHHQPPTTTGGPPPTHA
ncbi:hypothetical protein ACWEQL_12420, partial [Kitasatospora sp. NPDC004240]